MSCITGRRELGLLDGGYVYSTKENQFTDYSTTIVNGRRYFDFNENRYGSGFYNSPYMEINTDEYYQFGASTYTYQLSYNNRTGSGYFGIRQFDKHKRRISPYMSNTYGHTTLSRAATPGDTTIYVTNNSGWYTGTATSRDLIVFYPATHPEFSTPYYYSRFGARYDGPTMTADSAGDYSITLDAPLPNWGYDLPAGTPVSNGRGTNANTYNIASNLNYDNLNVWRTFTSGVHHGEFSTGGNFLNACKYVQMLQLINYRYRSEKSGDSARYYTANMLGLKCIGDNPYPIETFRHGLPGPFYD